MSVTAFRNVRGSGVLAAIASTSERTKEWSKIDSAGQIKSSGAIDVSKDAIGLEPRAAEAARRLFEDHNLIVAHCSHSQTTLVQTIWQKAEDA